MPLGLITLEGSFAGNTFSGFYNEVITNGDNSFTITGSVTVQLNEDQNEVSSVTFSKTTNWVNNSNSSNGSSVEIFSANNIPATRQGSSIYTVEHSSACDNISSLSYSRINNVPNDVNSSYSEFIEWYDCGGESEVTVFFSN